MPLVSRAPSPQAAALALSDTAPSPHGVSAPASAAQQLPAHAPSLSCDQSLLPHASDREKTYTV